MTKVILGYTGKASLGYTDPVPERGNGGLSYYDPCLLLLFHTPSSSPLPVPLGHLPTHTETSLKTDEPQTLRFNTSECEVRPLVADSAWMKPSFKVGSARQG